MGWGMYKPTLGVKLGLSYVLTLAILVVTGIIAISSVERLNARLTHVVDESWVASDGASKLSLLLRAAEEKIVLATQQRGAINDETRDLALESLRNARVETENLKNNPYGANLGGIDKDLTMLEQSANTLFERHQTWVVARQRNREWVDHAEMLMTRLGRYGNFLISNVEDTLLTSSDVSWERDIEPAWRFIISGYETRVALFASVAQAEFQQSASGDDTEALQNRLANLKEVLADLARSPMSERKVNRGLWKGQTYSVALDQFSSAYRESVDELMSSLMDFQHQRTAFLQQMEAALAKSDSFREFISRDVRDERDAAVESVKQLVVVVIVAVITGVLLGIFAMIFSYRGIIGPIKSLERRMDDIATGEGDLTMEIPVTGKDEISRLGGSFNLFMAKIRDLIRQVEASSEALNARADQQRTVSQRTLNATHEQQRASEHLEQAFDKLNQTVDEITDNAGNAFKGSQLAQDASTRGQTLMEENLQAIGRLSEHYTGASKVISELAEQSRQAGSILNVIQEVSEQTNLLALNAAIEAARAGDHGRGFAVVAEEVRGLAMRTQESTVEIHSLLETLRARANDAVQRIEEGSTQLQENTQITEKTASALAEINQAINDISQQNQMIATSTEEQMQLSMSTREDLERIKQASSETESGAENNAEGAQQVAEKTTEIRQLLRQFKT